MKMGSGSSVANAGLLGKEFLCKDVSDIFMPQLEVDRLVIDRHSLALIAGVIEVPSLIVVLPVLHRFAERKSEVDILAFRQLAALSTCSSIVATSSSSNLKILRFAIVQ